METSRARVIGLMWLFNCACGPTETENVAGDALGQDIGQSQAELKLDLLQPSNSWDVYPWPTQRNITYCVANVGTAPKFPNATFRNIIDSTFSGAAQQWGNSADVQFIHITSQDANCNAANSSVELNIVSDPTLPVGHTESSYPFGNGNSGKPRTIRVGPQNTGADADYAWQAVHEFGHALGFRHEEDTVNVLSVYSPDPSSVMNSGKPAGSTGVDILDRLAVQYVYGIPWESLGKPSVSIVGKPAISTWGPNRLDIFVRGSDSHLYWRNLSGTTWSAWSSLGGNIADQPAAVSWGANRVDVFSRGSGNDLQHIYYSNGTWSNWESLGLSISLGPAVSSWGANRLDVFAKSSTGNNLIHRWYSNGWQNGSDNLGGSIASSPSAVSWGSNRIDIVARGTGNDVVHLYWDTNHWSNWESLGGSIAQDPGITSWSANRLDVWVTTSLNDMWHLPFTGTSWGSGWEWWNGHHLSGFSGACWQAERVDLVSVGVLGDVEHAWRDPSDFMFKVLRPVQP